jgi:hypothetical protein
MAGLPKKLYYVLVKPGGTPLKFRQKGGGTYTNMNNAKGQFDHLQQHGSNVELYSTDVEWDIVESSQKNPMEGEPGLW